MLLQYWVREPEARGGCIPFRTGVLHPIFKNVYLEERFAGLTDPKLVRLFLQAEVMTKIPRYFLQGATFSELDLSGVPGVTAVGCFFLKHCASLHTADLSGWNNVARVEDHFLSSCTALRTLDLSGWNNVTHIGHSFLSNCTSLTTLDISGWSNVTQLGDYFLFNCSALKTLDLSGLTSVRYIRPSFLEGCTLPTSSINITGSCSVVSEHVHEYGGSLVDDTKCKCVCM